jgi:hypothetical protein
LALLTLLEKAGQDFNLGIKMILPYALDASSIVTLFDPPVGAVLSVIFNVVLFAENAYQVKPKSGPEKLAYAIQVLGPLAEEFAPAEGKSIEDVVNIVVAILNSRDENNQPIAGGMSGKVV